MAEKVVDNKYLMIDAIKSEYPGINEQGIAAIMGNIQLESAGGKFGREIPQTYEEIWSKGKSLRSMQGNITDYYNSIGIKSKKKQKQAYNKLVKENPESALGVAYMEDPNSSFAGGTGPLQLTIADYGAMKDRPEKFKALMLDSGFEGTFSEYMGKINTDPAFGLKETIRFYKKHGSKKKWSVDSLNNTTAKELGDKVINPGRDWITNEKWQLYQTAGNDSIVDYNTNYLPTITKEVPSGPKELTQAEKDQIAIDIQPTPAPLPKDVPNVLSQIEVDKENARKKQEEENKKKKEVYQPRELVPLSDLSEEEIDNLTNEEKKQYGLQPTIEIVGDSTKKKYKASDLKNLAMGSKEREQAYKDLNWKQDHTTTGHKNYKKIDKDGDGIPDTIDADAGESVPENQLTVSTKEQVVIDEQEKEAAIETVETEEMEVLDANGNIKKITVPTVSTPTTVDTEGLATGAELVKPKLKDFKASSDYMKARMKYFKSVEDQDELDFDNELNDDEIKETVDMEQNSTVIDASKRNIFKTNGKSNIFNSIIGDIDNLAKGIQQELNNITKSINNRD